jgi:four helix bundle protein
MNNEKMKMEERPNPLRDKSYAFALRIVMLYQHVLKEKREGILARQVLRSGTSIGAMVEEANQAESTADFVHKLSIANKEANETRYWLRLLKDSKIIEETAADSIILDCTELIRLLVSIIKTSKSNQ